MGIFNEFIMDLEFLFAEFVLMWGPTESRLISQ